MAREKVREKLASMFKEELWGRIEPRDTGISKFKILEDLFNSVIADDMIDETIEICRSHIEEHGDSITASYLIGAVGYHQDDAVKSIHLRKLVDIFIDHHKWAVVELLAEKILEYGESGVALRALATSLERLGRNKEAIPVLENLLKIDRFDAQVARKLATALMDSDPDKSTYYMKLSIEGFIRSNEFDEITPLWTKLVSNSWEDVTFFEKIERQLVDAKKHDLTASLLKILLNKYRDEENPDQSIAFLKKILEYRPDDSQARRDLVRLYEKKYMNHSQLDQFLRISNLNVMSKPVRHAIQDFERNIIFDRGNYAYHGSWGLGHIDEIDSEFIIISFAEKKGHRMSIQMAIQSLVPVSSDHFYVHQFEDAEGMKEMFAGDMIGFFTLLVTSFGGSISADDVKRELCPVYVDPKNWTKWWNRVRTQIRKNPHFGVTEKNTIVLRDKPMTLADELLDSFVGSDSFSEKLSIAIEFVNNVDLEDGVKIAPYLTDYFTEESKGDSITRLALSYFILNDLKKFVDESKLKLESVKNHLRDIVKQSKELPLLSRKITSYDYKKHLVQLIEETREDWPSIYYEILFELPVRIHKYLLNHLIAKHHYRIINGFIGRITDGYREFPELFLWVSRNLLNRSWNYDWLDYSSRALTTNFFRFLGELKKIEKDGNRMKNQAIEILTESNNEVIKSIAASLDIDQLGRLYDLFINVPFVEESHQAVFLRAIRERFPEFDPSKSEVRGQEDLSPEMLIVTAPSLQARKLLLDKMVSEDLARISRELAEVAETSGDIRENVDYTALMEKQNILEVEISKLGEDIKKAQILDPAVISTDSVTVGTRVHLQDKSKQNNSLTFDILGPWEADFENNILSYRSPIAASLIGKKVGDEAELIINDEVNVFRIMNIEKAAL